MAPIKQDLQWAKYKKKNEEQAKQREVIKRSQSVVGTPAVDR